MSRGRKSSWLPLSARVAVPLALLALSVILHSASRRLESHNASPYPVTRAPKFDSDLLNLPVWRSSARGRLAETDLPLELSFRPGQTLIEVLVGLGLTRADSQAVADQVARHADVRRLRPQDRYASLIDPAGRFRSFRLTLAGKGRVEVAREGEGWNSSWRPFVETTETRLVTGSLDGFLESSIERAGGEPVLAYAMADVLQWDLDFNRDLRAEDHFRVLYESVYLEGEFHRVGSVLALSYDNQGRRFEAYRFGEDQGHYDAQGRPLRKLFLRSPLRYSRITSGFSGRRFHPVLKRYRPHYGIDYGAPTGTPVRVTASGVVRFAGWDGGGGRTVKVRHPNGFLTAYLHLSRFANGVRPGRRVSQGEVIGYVGSTGLASGSHLDYRLQKDGRWLNPLKLKNEPADPIPPERLAEFFAWRDRLRRALQEGRWAATTAPEGVPLEAKRSAGEAHGGEHVGR